MKTIRAVQAVGLVVLAFMSILFGLLLAFDKFIRKPVGRKGMYIAIEAGLVLFLAVFLYFEYDYFIVNSVGCLIGFLLPNCLLSGKKQA